MKICGLTLAVYRDKIFFDLLPKLDPKPDYFVIKNGSTQRKIPNQLIDIAEGYNEYRNLAPEDTSHYWVVEDDCVLPEDVLGTICENMVDTNADVITVPVYNRFAKHIMIWRLKNINGKIKKVDIVDKGGLIPVDASSLNCFLIKKDVFMSQNFKPSNYNFELYVDTLFFTNLRKNGYTVYCNFDIRTEHGGLVWDSNNAKNGDTGL